MNCFKCGYVNQTGDRFCKNCGALLDNNYQQQSINNINSQVQQPINNTNNQSINNQQFNKENINFDSNPVNNEIIIPNMKKWAILSIVVPIVAIIWYWFIGLSTFMSIIIITLVFEFARRGELANKKLANIGKFFNWILIGITFIMFIINFLIGLLTELNR